MPALREHKDLLVKQFAEEWRILEQEERNKERREELLHIAKVSGKEVGKVLLVLLLLSGFVTIAAIAPNIFVVFGKISRKRRYFDSHAIQKAITYLKQKNYITVQPQNDFLHVEITKQGTDQALFHAYHSFKIMRPKYWDGLWHLIIFDIPEKDRVFRDSLRRKLRNIGFYQLQKSVFFYPYDCRKEIQFLADIHHAAGYVRYLVAQQVMHDADLRKHFSL